MKGLLSSIIVLGALGAALWFLPSTSVTDLSSFPTLTDATLAGRTIVDFGVSSNGTVSYSYLAEPVPPVLHEREVPELRTENSFTKLIAVTEEAEPVYTLETRFYSQPAYAQDADGTWRYLEYATTTELAFRNRDMTLWKALTELVVRTAYADSVSPFSGAGDGYSQYADTSDGCASAIQWNFVHDQLSGNNTSATLATGNPVGHFSFLIPDPFTANCAIDRGFFPFDTSAIPAAATISAATHNVYVSQVYNGENDGNDFITVVQTSQSTHTTLADADYDQCGAVNSPTEGVDSGQRKDLGSVSASAYLTFTLNTTGMGWIKKSGQASNCTATAGITCIGLRGGHDALDDTPTDSSASNGIEFAASEDNTGSGTDRDPYLSVTYSVGSALVQSGMKVGSHGSLKVTGGGIKIQ